MPQFNYQVISGDEIPTSGKIEADDIDGAADKLKGQGYTILRLRPASLFASLDLGGLLEKLPFLGGSELSPMERVMFTTNFAEMLKTGLPIVDAVSTFEDQTGSRKKRKMFKQIITEIRSGQPPSTVFAKYPRSFPPIYTYIMASGETTGTLGETMTYLADQLKRDYDLTSRVRGSLVYPAVVLVVMFVVMGFITFGVVPKITAFATSLGQDLPLPTKILIGTSKFLVRFSPVLVIGSIVLISFFLRFIRTKSGTRIFDKFVMRIPLIGTLIRRFDLARFSRLLGAFYHYGISLPKAFDTLSVSLSNYYYQQAALKIKAEVSQGVTLSAALDHQGLILFPKIMVQVVKGAEKSGAVDESLWRMADYYESELENSLKNLTTIIEPLMIVILGIAVVSIAIAVIVPIYKITVSLK